MKTLLNEIGSYWAKRSVSYSDGVEKSLKDGQKTDWLNELLKHFPNTEDKDLKILDIGTGPGFFAISLASIGYNVTAVDYTEAMLDEARKNAAEHNDKIKFLQMDAHSLDFNDNEFDIIVTRNLTWNLERPLEAYADWYRVLKKGGCLMNFDANWYTYLYNGEECKMNECTIDNEYHDYHYYPESDIMENISRSLPLSRYKRPQWDAAALCNIGFSKILIDTDIYKRTWTEDEISLYEDTPGFMVLGEK